MVRLYAKHSFMQSVSPLAGGAPPVNVSALLG